MSPIWGQSASAGGAAPPVGSRRFRIGNLPKKKWRARTIPDPGAPAAPCRALAEEMRLLRDPSCAARVGALSRSAPSSCGLAGASVYAIMFHD